MVNSYSGQCIGQISQKKSTGNAFWRLRYDPSTESEPISHTAIQCPCRDGPAAIAQAFCWSSPGFESPTGRLFYRTNNLPARQNRAQRRDSRFGPPQNPFLVECLCPLLRDAKSITFPGLEPGYPHRYIERTRAKWSFWYMMRASHHFWLEMCRGAGKSFRT